MAISENPSEERVLALDVGNTNVTLGVFEGDRLLKQWRLTTTARQTIDEARLALSDLFRLDGVDPATLSGAIICSVVPRLTEIFHDAYAESFDGPILQVDHTVRLDLPLEYDHPEEIGPDRLANAVGGALAYGAPLIVVDFGTAITFDVISAARSYQGGIILPGPLLTAESLARRAARLPLIAFESCERVVGRSTTEGIRAGLYFGLAGAIDTLIEKIREQTGENHRVVATGGLGRVIIDECRQLNEYDPHLTLNGMLAIWKLNR